jgi:hypothetical protein
VRSCLIHTCHAAPVPFPCHDHTVLKATSQGHGTARHGSGIRTAWYVWITIGCPETTCGRPSRVRLLPATTWISTKVVTRSIPISGAVRIFLSTTRTFTKDTALSENGGGAAWHVWINAAEERQRNSMWTAWERHGMCELAFTHIWRWNRRSVLKLWHLNYRRRWITQKNEYDIRSISSQQYSSGVGSCVIRVHCQPLSPLCISWKDKSEGETGGHRHLFVVHNSSCNSSVGTDKYIAVCLEIFHSIWCQNISRESPTDTFLTSDLFTCSVTYISAAFSLASKFHRRSLFLCI